MFVFGYTHPCDKILAFNWLLALALLVDYLAFQKVKPLVDVERFPLSDEAISALESLKKCVNTVTLGAIDESLPFTVETDASEQAVCAILNQQNRSVAFF